jgi:hypothetical protein
MTVDRIERVGEHYQWHAATDEIEDLRDHSRRSASEYSAKIDVYEDRVRNWFLRLAAELTANGESPADYVALAVTVAYIEGVEQYRRGSVAPRGSRGRWFVEGAARVFPGTRQETLTRLWKAVRCGLFHSGFTEGPVLLSHNEPEALRAAADGFLHINPARLVHRTIADFDSFIEALRQGSSSELTRTFTKLWDERWNETDPAGLNENHRAD